MERPSKSQKSSTTRNLRQRKSKTGDASTLVEKSNPVPGRSNKGPRQISNGLHRTGQPVSVEEREGQGLCVLIDGTWSPAVWHHELVASLDRGTYSVNFYDIEPPRRNDNQRPEDVTLFLAEQQSWGFEGKEHRPEILFQLLPTSDQYPEEKEPVPWMGFEINGDLKYVVDIISNRPLRHFINIPIQLATNVEGGRLEAMSREDSRITTEDFLQRMIPLLDDNGQPQRDGKGAIMHDRPTRSALSNVKTQFRNKCRCLSWVSLRHSSEFDQRLLRDISKEDRDDNTTKNLPDLTADEMTAIRSHAKTRLNRVKETNEDRGSEAASKELSELSLTDDVVQHSAVKAESGEETPEATEKEGIPATSLLSREVKYEVVAEPGTVVKRRSRRLKSGKKTVTVLSEVSQPPSGDTLQDGDEVIDPALTRPPTPASSASRASTEKTVENSSQTIDYPARSAAPSPSPRGDVQGNLTAPEVPHLVCGLDPESLSVDAAETREDVLKAARPLLKRKLADEEQDAENDPIQSVENSGLEAGPSASSPKRQKIQPPTNDYQQLLKDFAATQRSGAPTSDLGSAQHRRPFSTLTLELGRKVGRPRRSHSPRPYGSRQLPPLLPRPTPLNRPRPFYSPPPPSTASQQERPEDLEAEQARFASVSAKFSSLELLKTRLMQAWQNDQRDTTSGASLYGPHLNISLSLLGPSTSALTDTEMRTLMTTTFNIPPRWSASSIDLRQHPALRQAVHIALCEAERFNVRSYHKDFPRFLTPDTEGGFFLATASPFSNRPTDSRFALFHSSATLNKCLGGAMQRYNQLTGRVFAPFMLARGSATAAAGALGTSYHDAWCEIRRQLFLPYFLRFADPVEAVAWMPGLGVLGAWEGGAEKWPRNEGGAAVGGDGGKIFLPLGSVDLEGNVGVVRE